MAEQLDGLTVERIGDWCNARCALLHFEEVEERAELGPNKLPPLTIASKLVFDELPELARVAIFPDDLGDFCANGGIVE